MHHSVSVASTRSANEVFLRESPNLGFILNESCQSVAKSSSSSGGIYGQPEPNDSADTEFRMTSQYLQRSLHKDTMWIDEAIEGEGRGRN